MELHKKIIECLRSQSKSDKPYDYINPNFLLAITDAVYAYYDYEDDDVDSWVQDMFGA